MVYHWHMPARAPLTEFTMGIIADQLRETIRQLELLDAQQVERTEALVESANAYIRSVDTLLEDLSDIGED